MTNIIVHRVITESPVRRRVMGIIFLLISIGIWLLFARNRSADQITTFTLVPGGSGQVLPNLVLPSSITLYVLAILAAVLGGYQLARGFKKYTNLMLGLVMLFFIFGFLVWATSDKSLNLAGLLMTTLYKSVPITLGALSGILCERAGVTNIAIEGMMLTGAMTSVLIASLTHNLWIGLLAGILAGAILAAVHAVLSIKYKINQIISGTVINIFAAGFTSYISAKFLQVYQNLNSSGVFQPIAIPILSDIPFIGPILFRNTIFVYSVFLLLIIMQIAYFYTRWGLRMRSVGEHPKAADTLGINVIRTRYIAVILGGCVAGLAGCYFTIGNVGRFDEMMTAGRGFIGLAAMIFGNWMPFGSFGAGLLFGFADSLQTRLSILSVNIPSEFLLMAPYILTMIILAGLVGKGQMPAADGTPYEKE